MKTSNNMVIAMIGILSVMLTFITALADQQEFNHRSSRVLKFDVAENATRFVFDEAPVHEETTPAMPAYGNPFITEGYIYPYGTIECNDTGECTGVNPDGSPQYPDQVIGRWTCRGWFVGNGALTETGPIVITTQLYDLGETPGEQSIVSEGYELIDINAAVKRAIIGGTGRYRAVRGEAKQTLLGFNELVGVSLRFKIQVRKR